MTGFRVVLAVVVGMASGLDCWGYPSLLGAQSVTVTVTGVGNSANVRWSRLPKVSSFTVARRQLVIDRTGQVQSATSYAALATVTGFGYDDVLPTPAVVFEYQVSANASGRTYPSAPVQYVAPPFTTVTTLAVTGSGTRADLAWAAAYGVVGYQVWRRTIQRDGSTSNLGQLTAQPLAAPGFVDPTLVLGELYEYQVASLTADGLTWPSGWVRYSAPAPPVAPPLVAPVVAIGGAADRVILTWTFTAGATGYQVSRYLLNQTGQRTTGGQLTPSALAADNYTDALPAPGLYEYQVTAVLPDGSLLPSQRMTYPAPAFTTPLGVAAAAVGLRGVVAWYPALGVTGFQVWRRFPDPYGKVTLATQVASVPATGTVWLDGLPDATSMVEYQVVGVSADGRTWPSAWVRGR